MIHKEIRPNGNLRFTLIDDETAREYLRELRETYIDVDVIVELTEPYWANGGPYPLWPVPGLTDAPGFAEELDIHDDGSKEIRGRLWWYPQYAVADMVEDLLEKGYVEFQLAPEAEVPGDPGSVRRDGEVAALPPA